MNRVARCLIYTLCAAVVTFLAWYGIFRRRIQNGSSELDSVQLVQDEDPFRSAEKLTPTILLATLWFKFPWPEGLSTGKLLRCPARGNSALTVQCKVTVDKSLFGSSDAVVFHIQGTDFEPSVKKLKSLKRPVDQIWVMYVRESPLNIDAKKLKYFDNHGLNWTATYMKNSDVPTAYYGVVPGVYHGGFNPKRNYLAGRTGMATILVSNCVISRRMAWIKKIKQYINVKVYGKCGSACSMLRRHKCMAKLKKYKFYLSFENTYCHDYITEKIISNAFENDIIPVVIADVNFTDTSIIPPGSVINALNFSSVKELTDYMKKVGSNSTLYNEYFKWHSHYKADSFTSMTSFFLCPLCGQIATNNSTKTYKSVHDWYSREKLCREYPVPL